MESLGFNLDLFYLVEFGWLFMWLYKDQNKDYLTTRKINTHENFLNYFSLNLKFIFQIYPIYSLSSWFSFFLISISYMTYLNYFCSYFNLLFGYFFVRCPISCITFWNFPWMMLRIYDERPSRFLSTKISILILLIPLSFNYPFFFRF